MKTKNPKPAGEILPAIISRADDDDEIPEQPAELAVIPQPTRGSDAETGTAWTALEIILKRDSAAGDDDNKPKTFSEVEDLKLPDTLIGAHDLLQIILDKEPANGQDRKVRLAMLQRVREHIAELGQGPPPPIISPVHMDITEVASREIIPSGDINRTFSGRQAGRVQSASAQAAIFSEVKKECQPQVAELLAARDAYFEIYDDLSAKFLLPGAAARRLQQIESGIGGPLTPAELESQLHDKARLREISNDTSVHAVRALNEAFSGIGGPLSKLESASEQAFARMETERRDAEAAFFAQYGLPTEPTAVSLSVNRARECLKDSLANWHNMETALKLPNIRRIALIDRTFASVLLSK